MLYSSRNILFLFAIFWHVIVFGQNSRNHIKAAEQLCTNGYYKEAIEELNKAINIDPQNGHAYEERALIFERLKNWENAAADYQNSAVFGSNPSENFLKAAEIFINLNKTEQAFIDLGKAINQNPKYYEAYLLQSKTFYNLGRFSESLVSAENAVSAKGTAYAYFLKGMAEFKLNDIKSAESDFEKAIVKDKFYPEAYLALAKLQLQNGQYQKAIENCSYVIMNDRNNTDAYITRSRAYNKLKELEKTISDISKAISIDSVNSDYYMIRGDCYFEYGQFQNAITDYTVAINQNTLNMKALGSRALSYERINNKQKAVSDYSLLLTLADKQDEKNISYLENKIFELKREYNKPVITITEPRLTASFEVPVPTNLQELIIKGKISDESKIKFLRINSDTLINSSAGVSDSIFSVTVSSENLEFLTLSAIDIYDNVSTVSYGVRKIETDPPQIILENPLVVEENRISPVVDDNYLYIEGRIEGKNLISSIHIDEVNASYAPGDLNPRFTATLDISKKNKIKIIATDIFGNIAEREYYFEQNEKIQNNDSPMGKTWAVLIENSQYKDFANLSSPPSDINLVQDALARYKINNIIIKKNLTKREFERFFSIDLRDLVRINHVNSLIIWYAGHGQNIKGIGYWVPCDATKDDEFSYYNIFALKASLYSYMSLNHLLVISDACSTGPGFNLALRGTMEGASCDQTELALKKSAQVFTSAGEGYAYDNSLFTRAFANALLNNENECVSIDDIANKVCNIIKSNNAQNPEFGRIAGLDDQLGTFFFISK